MTFAQAVILGLVEGITEFLPVSSTAHLIIGQRLLGMPTVSEFFTTVVQLGALGGLVWQERIQLQSILKECIDGSLKLQNSKTKFQNTRFVRIGIATLPVLVVGFLLKDFVSAVHSNLSLIAFMSVAIGLVLFVAEKMAGKVDKKSVGLKELVVMGIFQVISLVPGTSRSGITAAGGAFQKMSISQALEYSFLLSIPALSLAGIYEILKFAGNPVGTEILFPTLIGTIAAFVSSILAIEWLRSTVKRIGFTPFVLYRLAFAVFILLFF